MFAQHLAQYCYKSASSDPSASASAPVALVRQWLRSNSLVTSLASRLSEGASFVVVAQDVIAAMRATAPAGQSRPDDSAIGKLRSLTADLIAARPAALAEAERFQATALRAIPLDAGDQEDWLAGRTVLVTGGTGCIGSALLPLLDKAAPGRLVSVSRGVTVEEWPRLPQAEYRHADIADAAALAEVFADVRPDVVFHLAAQRDPGRAERAVVETVRTNVLGTRNVAALAARYGVADVICATSGKALRPYSHAVYTATKRLAEWLLAHAAAAGRSRYSAVRFTHVVDNSIVYRRMRAWAGAPDGVLRLHDPDTMFYAQSALESAQLMIYSGLHASAAGLRTYAISDLGWPVSLLDLALGTLQQAGSVRPVYFSGHDPGYEAAPFPGLYDPATAGDVSPLFNGFEAQQTEHDSDCGVDACRPVPGLSQVPDNHLASLEQACARTDDHQVEAVRAALDELSWLVFNAAIAAVPKPALQSAIRQAESQPGDLSCEHTRMLEAMRQHAGSAAFAVA
jgi:nucleoside-diphosphate-sugar epimerase